MKKLVLLVAAAFMCASLAACGSSSNSSSSAAASGSASAGASASASGSTEADEPSTTDGGTLTMGTNAAFPPYEYYENDHVVGIDAEIAQAVAEKLGMELKIEDMDFSSLITAVQTGKIDMVLAGMTVTEDYAIAIAKDNTELLDKINNALKELKEDGSLDEIIGEYIKAE